MSNVHFGRGIFHASKEIKVPFDIIDGYYIVVKGESYFLGRNRDIAAEVLDRDADKYLNESNGYNYYIDYCFGYDVDGRLLWSEFDRSNDLC